MNTETETTTSQKLVAQQDIERADALKSVPFNIIDQNARHTWTWLHSFLQADGKIRPTIYLNHLIAIFDDGVIVKFTGQTGKDHSINCTSDRYSVGQVIETVKASRIEVRQHQYREGEFEQKIFGENSRMFLRYVDKQGVSIIMQAPDGKLTQLIDYHHNNDIQASNVAVEIRNTLQAVFPDEVGQEDAQDSEGFDL